MSTETRLKTGVFRCFMGSRTALDDLTWLVKWRVLGLYTCCMPRRQSWLQPRRNRVFGSLATGLVIASSLWKPLSVQVNRVPAPHTSASRHLRQETRLADETISCGRFPRPLHRLSVVSSSVSRSELSPTWFRQAHPATLPSTCKPPCASVA